MIGRYMTVGSGERGFDVAQSRVDPLERRVLGRLASTPDKAPAGTSAKMLDRDARRRSRIDLETQLVDFVIHPDMDYAASPRASYFRQAQAAGEVAARQLLPDLIEKIGQARRHLSGAAGG